MDQLKEMGEFVRSASSTIEAPVVRRLKEAFASKAAEQSTQGSKPRPAGSSAPRDGAAAAAQAGPAASGGSEVGARPRPDNGAGTAARDDRVAAAAGTASGASGASGGSGARPRRGPPPTGRPTAPRRRPRPRPTAPSRAGPPPVPRPPMRLAGCRRSRRRLRPGPGPPSRGPRGLRPLPVPRGRRGRRGPRPPRPPRPTSVVRGRAKGSKGGQPGLRFPVAAGRAALAGSAQAPLRAVPTSRAKGPRAVRGRGRPRRGPRVLVLPGRVRPGLAAPVRARALRVPARGRATTRSARPRPAWGRRLRLGPRAQAHLGSRVIPAVPVLRRAPPVPQAAQGGQEVQGVRARLGAVRVGPACPMAARGPAGSRVRVPAVPGRAR